MNPELEFELTGVASQPAAKVPLAAVQSFTIGATGSAMAALCFGTRPGLWGLVLVWILLLPIGIACAAALAMVRYWATRRSKALAQSFYNSRSAERLAVVGLFAAIIGIGSWISNVALLARWAERPTLIGYAVSVLVAAGSAWLLRRSFRRGYRVGRFLTSRPRLTIATILLVSGLGVAMAMNGVVRIVLSGPAPILVSAFAVVLLVAAIFATGWSPRLPWAFACALVLAIAMPSIPVDAACTKLLSEPSAGRPLLRAARHLADRDHDGFSSILAGGDCDDADPAAYPMSPVRDCNGWRSSAAQEDEDSVAPLVARNPEATVPVDRILLLTIDAFRCGFGAEDEPLPELRSACPQMTELAREGAIRGDAHTISPSTKPGIYALFAGRNSFQRADKATFLSQQLGLLGFRTSAVITHPYVFGVSQIREGLDELDLSLVDKAKQAAMTTSQEVTDKLLERISKAPNSERLLAWAHYYDTHAPHLYKEGSPWSYARTTAYAAEVARVDSAIGNLAEQIRKRPDADRFLVVAVADHGEQLGDHGGFVDHGLSLYETGLKVPILTWSPNEKVTSMIRARALPRTLQGVSPYLLSILSGREFHPAKDVFFYANPGGRNLYGVLHEQMKLIYGHEDHVVELYDLANDPAELRNLAPSMPERVHELGAKIATRFFAMDHWNIGSP